MEKVIVFIVLSLGLVACSSPDVVYVAERGDDASEGTLLRPVRTVSAAVAKVRARRAKGVLGADDVCTISIAKGNYPISETLTLGAGDSHVRLKGEKGQTVITGGFRLPPSTDGGDGVWRVRLPSAAIFDQLWVNGRRAQRAKTPNDGYLFMKSPCYPETEDPERGQAKTPLGYRAFFAFPHDVSNFVGRRESELSDVVIRAWHSWNVSTARLKSVREDGMVLGSPIPESFPYFHWKGHLARYEIENYREALDAPGEWFLDRATGELSYLPRVGEKIDATICFAPRLSHLLKISGDRAEGEIARDIRFSGLTFECAGYGLAPDVNVGVQGASGLGAAIEAGGCEDVSFSDCVVRHVGLSGLWFRKGARHCRVERTLVEDVGASAVRIGEDRWDKTEPSDRLTAFVSVANCILRCGGRVNGGAPGVLLQHASDCDVTHCEIADFLYTGVSCGWTWGYRASPSLRNLIGWNHIHHVGQGQLSDMGGIYHLGDATGTRIVGNVIHDVQSYDLTGHGGHGIYMDEGTSHLVVESNLVYRVKGRCLNQNYGRDNLVRNNVFAKPGEALAHRSDDDPFVVFCVSNCIGYVDSPDVAAISGSCAKPGFSKNVLFGANLYEFEGGVPERGFFKAGWADWTSGGQDVGSRIVSGLFVDPENDDFRLKDERTARATGFVPWSYADAGVYGDADWRDLAKVKCVSALSVAEPPLYTRNAYSTGFESQQIGFGSFSRFRDAKHGYGIEICTNAPHAGRHCVRFADKSDARFGFWPHMNIDLSASTGKVEMSVWLKTDGGTHLEITQRDYHPAAMNQGFADGPSVTIAGNSIRAGGKTMKVPVNEWWRLGVLVDLSVTPVSYDVTAMSSDGQATSLRGLGAGSAFRHIEWVGFMSNSRKEGVFYLDDFEFVQK